MLGTFKYDLKNLRSFLKELDAEKTSNFKGVVGNYFSKSKANVGIIISKGCRSYIVKSFIYN